MNEIQLFNNPEFGEIRTIDIDGSAWFVGKDIADILGYQNGSRDINRHVDDDDKLTHKIRISGQMREVILINESGVYSLIFGSNLDNAKKFKHWVTSDVLPQIHRTGAYSINPQSQTTLDIQLLNASTMNANVYVNLLQHIDTKSESYKSVLMACAANTAAGQLVLPLPKCDFGKTYSATDVGRILGISKQKVGRIANEYGLKTDDFGQWYHDVTPNGRECDNFRYNDAAVLKFREILSA